MVRPPGRAHDFFQRSVARAIRGLDGRPAAGAAGSRLTRPPIIEACKVPAGSPPRSSSSACPVFLLLTNVRMAAMEPRVYEYSFATYDVPAVTGIDRAQLDAAARDIVAYFGDERPLLTTQVTIGGRTEPCSPLARRSTCAT